MSYNTPKEIAVEFCSFGMCKTKLPFAKFALLSFLGGAFIALGGLLSVIVAGGLPGIAENNPGLIKFIAGALFPVGLIMVSVAGADLFTSDCAAMMLPFKEKQINFNALLKVWVLSYIFNFFGTQFIAYFMTSSVDLVAHDPWRSYLHNYSMHKVDQDFYKVLLKGIGANWLVCLGTWMGFAGKDIVSKSLGIWLPVMLFVTLGYEHSIANMFFIPTAIYTGADITWADFIIKNLIPSTIGNIIGGASLVGCVYWYIYMKTETK
ncbi:MAG: putative formate transporter 1 [Alphaproteobacteria bacterium ADurb.Bin438]|nr:MAG: putative formate transporter 1 [Alphaproteobacteria bacterium ADurb.Bin438]